MSRVLSLMVAFGLCLGGLTAVSAEAPKYGVSAMTREQQALCAAIVDPISNGAGAQSVSAALVFHKGLDLSEEEWAAVEQRVHDMTQGDTAREWALADQCLMAADEGIGQARAEFQLDDILRCSALGPGVQKSAGNETSGAVSHYGRLEFEAAEMMRRLPGWETVHGAYFEVAFTSAVGVQVPAAYVDAYKQCPQGFPKLAAFLYDEPRVFSAANDGVELSAAWDAWRRDPVKRTISVCAMASLPYSASDELNQGRGYLVKLKQSPAFDKILIDLSGDASVPQSSLQTFVDELALYMVEGWRPLPRGSRNRIRNVCEGYGALISSTPE